MKTLCIFANEFPYGSWEAYLETEVKFYSEFDKVYIFSLQLRKEHAKQKDHFQKILKLYQSGMHQNGNIY